jgi:tRNA modification GTPase
MPVAPDTIVAISTPPGRGGIGIVRLSGPAAVSVASQMVRLPHSADSTPGPPELNHRQARLVTLHDPAGTLLDTAVATPFFAPNSYTGEDVVELAAHGSPVVLDEIVAQALALSTPEHPVRLARAGEFSERAFLSGRIDLTQAEAIHDLIAAQTLGQARTAAQQMGGALSRRIAPIKQNLLHLVAMLEAGMDFASGELDDVDTMPPARIAASLEAIHKPLAALAASFRTGLLERNGARLALVGAPNAGKSSLFNRLLERERAIVTATPGTTRDTLEEAFALDGIPVRLVDTAGLREAASPNVDEAEALGIARSREALADADIVLVVRDASVGAATHDDGLGTDGLGKDVAELLRGRPVLRVANKIDLLPTSARELMANEIATSAMTGEGLDELRSGLLRELRGNAAASGEAALNNARQAESVQSALAAIQAAREANAAALPHEVLLIDLHQARAALDALTGETTTDDILGLIFSQFCIGK